MRKYWAMANNIIGPSDKLSNGNRYDQCVLTQTGHLDMDTT